MCAQLRPTLCDPMDWSLPGSSIHGIFQARVLEWGAIAFSDALTISEQIATDKYQINLKNNVDLKKVAEE